MMTTLAPTPPDHPTSKIRRNLVIALGFLWVSVPAIMGMLLLAELGPVGDWLATRGEVGIVIFIAIFACSTGFGLLPPYAQAIVGGWVFGTTLATTAVMCGLLAGATIGFAFARLISGHAIIGLIDRNPRAKVIRAALVETNQPKTFVLILLLRLPPNSPFAIANLAMGASGVRALPFLAGTMLGMLPRTMALCMAASAAAATGAKDFQALFAQQGWLELTIGFGGLLLALGVITAVSRRALARAGLLGSST